MSGPAAADTHISTSHSYFLRPAPNPSHPPISLLLRGVNISSTSKYPNLSNRPPITGDDATASRTQRNDARRLRAGVQSQLSEEDGGMWRNAEAGGSEGWFVGHPFTEDKVDIHLRRLRAWGFTTIRYLITWEALEHAGPGKYDEAYIDYTINILRRCKAFGFRVFVSAHQDVFSRFISGTGAPYWVLEAVGLNPRRIHQTGSALVHACWATEGYGGEEGRSEAANGKVDEFPDMIWNTNLHRLAARHCFTMTWASKVFAPRCKIDGLHASEWLRQRFVSAYGHLADRLQQAGGLLDDCVIGWDSMNEPHEGFIGIPDLNEFPPAQAFKKGPCPTPIQNFQLGMGQPVSDIQTFDFTSLGEKKKGNLTLTPPEGKGVWLTRSEAREAEERWGWKWGEEWDFWDANGEGGCPWAGHGVWDPSNGNVIRANYFEKPKGGDEYDFITDFWRPHYEAYIGRIRRAHPDAISFVNPPVFGSPPDLSENTNQGRMALSAHFYDGLTLLGKRRHMFNADAVGVQRGLKSVLSALKIGSGAIRSGMRDQLAELKSDSRDQDGIASDQSGKKEYPTIIGEIGVPFDMKKTRLFGLAKGKESFQDYREPTKAMDEVLNGCDGENALSYTIWAYEPSNTHRNGDGWNGEDLSLFSYDDTEGDLDLVADNPPDMRTLITLGARGIDGWCRPYPAEVAGRLQSFSFDMSSTAFALRIEVISLEGSRLWQADRDQASEGGGDTAWKDETSALIYVPYVHYLVSTVPDGAPPTNRLIGRPGKDGEQWVKGNGPALVDLKLEELSEGRLEVDGQWMRWFYPLRRLGDREISLKFRKWSR